MHHDLLGGGEVAEIGDVGVSVHRFREDGEDGTDHPARVLFVHVGKVKLSHAVGLREVVVHWRDEDRGGGGGVL